MRLIRGPYNLKPEQRGCVATIGNFDGVHLGHQHVLQQLLNAGERLQLPTAVLTTEPLSIEFFSPDTAPPRLSRLREKLALFDRCGVDRVLCQRFTRRFADISAEQFVQSVLVGGLGVKHLVIGDDTRFGHQRRGDFELLQKLGRQYGFSVEKSVTLLSDGQRVSSSRVRAALAAGQLQQAAGLLGRPYHMSGRVAHGDKRGRELGFPTANIDPKRRLSPVMGIFAVTIRIENNPQALPAVASVGLRPTFGGNRCLLEVHIFDFEQDIYGRHVDVAFHQKLRDERHFNAADELVRQMRDDALRARAFFAAHPALTEESTPNFAQTPTNG